MKMIIADATGVNSNRVSGAAALVGRWCGVPADKDGEIWASFFLNRKIVEMESGARVGFRFKNGDVHSRSAASLRGPVKDKMFRWHKSATWGGGKRLWSPCPPDMKVIRFILLVEGETSAVAAAYALAFHCGWWVVATTGAGMFPEPTSEPGATLRRIMRASNATAVAWPDDDTAGSKWLEGAAETLEGFPLGQVTGAEGDPRSVWRTMLVAEGLDAATGRFAGMCGTAAEAAEPLAVKLPETERETERSPYRPVLPPAAWMPSSNGKREPQPRGAIRRWLARKHPTQDSLMLAGAQPRGRGKMSCWNKEAHRAGDRNPSLSVTGRGEEEHFRCFGCGERGDIFVAYALGHHGGDSKAAARHIYEQIRRESGG